MSQAENLLNSLIDETPVHEHTVIDPDSYFIIDPDTREIDNVSRTKNVLMQYDHNSEVYTFELPRYVEGHDMTLCNRVLVHFDNIDGETNEERPDVAEMTDLAVNEDDPSKVISSWTISRNATQLAGTLNFLVQYMCVADDGTIVYEWHTDIYDKVYVNKGRKFGEQTVIEYSDILEQWRQRLFGAGDSVATNITELADEKLAAITKEGETQVSTIIDEAASQKESIARKGEETLASIPADYTTVYNMADEALRTKADAINLTAEGEYIFVDDSSNDFIKNLKLYGRTTQATTTGSQLISNTLSGAITVSGLTVAPTENGDIQVNGTHIEGAMWVEFGKASLTAGKTYILSCTEGFSLHLWDLTNNKEYRTKKLDASSTLIEPTESIECAVVLNDAILGKTYTNVNVSAVLNEGSTALSWEPYTGGIASPNPDYPQDLVSVENPTADICGKNLVSDSFADWTVPNNYLIFELNNHGLPVTVNAYEKDASVDVTDCYFGLTNDPDNPSNKYSWILNKGSILQNNITRDYRYAMIFPNTEETFNRVFGRYNIQIELGESASEYDTYRERQSLTIPHTLPAVNGICDEIDFERGVYIQRVGSAIYDGTEYWSIFTELDGGVNQFYIQSTTHYHEANSVCVLSDSFIPNYINNRRNNYGTVYTSTSAIAFNTLRATTLDEWKAFLAERYAAGKPVTVQYILATPIETPVTEEEIAAFRKLKTNYHNTTVLNDAGAHMELDYVADTLIYLRDNQPVPTDEQVQKYVDAWLEQYFTSAEGVSF